MYHLDFRVEFEDTHNKLVQTMQINGVWPGHAESSETMRLVEGENDVAVKVGPNYFQVWLNGVKYEESVVVDAARLSRYNSIIFLQTGTCVTFGMEQSYTYTIDSSGKYRHSYFIVVGALLKHKFCFRIEYVGSCWYCS